MTITNRPIGNQVDISIHDDIHKIAAERHYLRVRVRILLLCIINELDWRFAAHPQ